MSASAAESSPAALPNREDAPVTENPKATDGEQRKPYSKKVAKKKKEKVAKQKEVQEEVQTEERKSVRNKDSRLFRSTFKPMLNLMEEVNRDAGRLPEPVIGSLKNTGFWNFIEIFYQNRVHVSEMAKVTEGLENLIASYTEEEDGVGCFELSTTVKIAPSVKDMAVIFGLPLNEESVDDVSYIRLIKKKQQQPTPPASLSLCRDYFTRLLANTKGKHSEVTNKEVRDKFFELLRRLRGGDNAVNPDDLAKLIIFHLCQTVFFTKSGGSNLPYRFLALVDSVDVINSICWPRLILAYVMDSLKRSRSKTEQGDYSMAFHKLEGCTIYFLYWFAEHSKFVERKFAPIPDYPRFFTWNGYDISNFLKAEYHKKMRSKMILEDLVIPVGEEEGHKEEEPPIEEVEKEGEEEHQEAGGDNFDEQRTTDNFDDSAKELEDLRRHHSDILAQNEELKEKLKEMEAQGAQLRAANFENAILKEKLKVLQAEEEQQRAVNVVMEGSVHELEDLRRHHSDILAQNEELKEKLKELEAQESQQRTVNVLMEGSVHELEDLRKQNSVLKAQNEELKENLKEMEAQGAQLRAANLENEKLKEKLKELEAQELQQRAVNILMEGSVHELEDLRKQNSVLKSDLHAQVRTTEQLGETNERLVEEKRELQNKVESFNIEANEKDGKIVDLQAMVVALQREEIQVAAELAAPKEAKRRGGSGGKRLIKSNTVGEANKKRKVNDATKSREDAKMAELKKNHVILRECDELLLWKHADEELKKQYIDIVIPRKNSPNDMVYEFFPEEGENEVSVQLSAVDMQDILNYDDMEAGILDIIIRKMKEIQGSKRCAPSSSKEVPLIQKKKPAAQSHKWSAFMTAHTLTVIQRVNEENAKQGACEDIQIVEDFVMGLEDDIELLFIPLFNATIKHYTLLTFNFISYDWTHYNSLWQTTYDTCKVDAELTKKTLEPIVRRKVDMMRERCPTKKEYESKVLNCSLNCPQQRAPNCLLYTAYYMNRLTTPFEIPEGNDNEIHQKMTTMRLSWAKELLSSKYVKRS